MYFDSKISSSFFSMISKFFVNFLFFINIVHVFKIISLSHYSNIAIILSTNTWMISGLSFLHLFLLIIGQIFFLLTCPGFFFFFLVLRILVWVAISHFRGSLFLLDSVTKYFENMLSKSSLEIMETSLWYGYIISGTIISSGTIRDWAGSWLNYGFSNT